MLVPALNNYIVQTQCNLTKIAKRISNFCSMTFNLVKRFTRKFAKSSFLSNHYTDAELTNLASF